MSRYSTMKTPEGIPEWRQVEAHLDEALQKLTAADRQLVVLRYFEALDYPQIGSLTGRSQAALRKQLQRALERLGNHFKRRGVNVSGAVLGSLLAAHSLCVPPASAAVLAATVLQIAPLAAPSFFTISSRSRP
ncbi:RNA polymerase sigma factor [Luteolibacter sp. Populi]|uniref:RNA polymerase sigma factor n=1 Tax=Luteolibacter sp. Populi TaxID=3230487 RepID=UPI003467B139